MTHSSSQTFPPRASTSTICRAPSTIKAGLTRGTVVTITHPVATLDMLLCVSPFNKPFLAKLDLTAFSLCLMAPSASGGQFADTCLSQNSGGIYFKTPQWMSETADSAKPYIYTMFFPIHTYLW